MNNNVKLNEKKVLNEYFDYLKSDEAAIVYIVKNLVNNLDSKRKWIDVVDFDCWGSRGGMPAFNYIVVALFDRMIFPSYPSNASFQLKKAITWRTCHNDISQQRSKGIRGKTFLITCNLFNKNKGKLVTKLFHNWNEEYGGFDYSGKVPTRTIRRKVQLEPKWEYRITGCRKINYKRFIYIKENYEQIYERILDEKHVLIEWFFENYHERK
ncbi:hypothetical protein AA0X95_20240 [Bacillus sp. 1P10SD]|uniref:hypothetical protein n=1 Tax=Bacillus sp. 1P10SD TaxID=3132265 RepID=UPI0039A68D20